MTTAQAFLERAEAATAAEADVALADAACSIAQSLIALVEVLTPMPDELPGIWTMAEEAKADAIAALDGGGSYADALRALDVHVPTVYEETLADAVVIDKGDLSVALAALAPQRQYQVGLVADALSRLEASL